MNAGDFFDFLQAASTYIIVLSGAGAVLWRLVFKRMWENFRGLFIRLDAVEEGQDDLKKTIETSQVMNRDAFSGIREAITEEGERLSSAIANVKEAAVTRLDHINGTVGRHEKAIHEQDKQIAVNAAKQEAAMEVLTAITRTARMAGARLTLGHQPPPDASQDEDDDEGDRDVDGELV